MYKMLKSLEFDYCNYLLKKEKKEKEKEFVTTHLQLPHPPCMSDVLKERLFCFLLCDFLYFLIKFSSYKKRKNSDRLIKY